MDFNPDNLIFFYLTLAIILLAMSVLVHGTLRQGNTKKK